MKKNITAADSTAPETTSPITEEKISASQISNPLKITKSAKLKEIGVELQKIYQDDKGKLPQMTGLEFKKPNTLLRVVIYSIIGLIIILTVSILGFFAFQPSTKFSGDKVSLEIKAPFNAVAGEKINYQINFSNNEEVSLTNGVITVHFPAGFILDSATPQPEAEISDVNQEPKLDSEIRTWKINDLYIGQNGTINLEGRLIAEKNSKQIITANLSYKPANFNSEFQKNITFSTDISETIIKLTTQAPSQISASEAGEYIISLENTSTAMVINDAQLELNMPTDFKLLSSQVIEAETSGPIIDETKNSGQPSTARTWDLANFEPQAKRQIKIKGNFEVAQSGNQQFNVKIKLKGPADNYLAINEQTIAVEVIKGDLLTQLIINGSDKNTGADFGSTLNYLLTIKNKSKKALADIKIRAIIDSPFLNWDSFKDENQGVRDDNQLLWTKEKVEKLAKLLPEEELQIPFQININLYKANSHTKPEDFKVSSFFEAQINKIDDQATDVVLTSNTIINQLNSDLNLTAEARYFDNNNQTIGSGPLPPIANQKTSYKIFYKITNSLHEISKIELRAKLPDYVTFEGQEKYSTGSLIKTTNNEILWQISGIPTSVNEATAEFSLSITPTEQDIHKILNLLPEIKLTATDNQTQTTISRTASGLTTNLDNDPQAKGKGLVQPE